MLQSDWSADVVFWVNN